MNKILSTLSTAASTAALMRLFRPHRTSLAVTVLGYAGTFLAGVAVGTAAGLMLAPKSGRELRADLKTGANNVGGELKATATTFKAAAQRVTHATEAPNESIGADASAPH